jgi:hypothetical protein
MPAVKENYSELLQQGYHHLRNPQEYEVPIDSPGFEARLRALRERRSPPLPSLKQIFQMLKEAWKEAGEVWDAKRAQKTNAMPMSGVRIRKP